MRASGILTGATVTMLAAAPPAQGPHAFAAQFDGNRQDVASSPAYRA